MSNYLVIFIYNFNENPNQFQDILNSNRYSSYEIACVAKLDEITWPNLLRLYLKHRKKELLFDDYYTLTAEKRVDILLELTSNIHCKYNTRTCDQIIV